MISSAVVVPENEAETKSSNLKRKQSSSSSDSNKRPRIESREVVNNVSIYDDQNVTAPTTKPSPSQRRSSAFGTGLGKTEEKKRGQRLFGSLLGTLSQSGTKPTHKKRDEIEARQRERLKKEDEEREEQRRRRKEELDKRRQTEQRDWDEEGMRLRHRNMRSTAGFLRTKAEPRLYYKPWEWREEEEQQIARQKGEVEEAIQRELSEQRATKSTGPSDPPMDSETHSKLIKETSSPHEDSESAQAARADQEVESKAVDLDESAEHNPENLPNNTRLNMDASMYEKTSETPEQEKPNHDDHHGEELVEGQEDDVIY